MASGLIDEPKLYATGVDNLPVLRIGEVAIKDLPDVPTKVFLAGQEPPSTLTVKEKQPSGTLVGVLTVDAGTPPFAYTIEDDPSNAYQIVGNELRTSRELLLANEPATNVSIKVTDNLGNFYISSPFTITTVAVTGAFLNEKSYQFGGATSFMVFNERLHSAGNLTDPNFSIGLWLKIDDLSQGTIFSTKDASGVGVNLRLTGGFNAFEVNAKKNNGNTKSYFFAPPSNFVASAWNLFGVVFDRDNDSLKLYINGISLGVAIAVNDTLSGSIFPDNDTYIGSSSVNTDYFKGYIDEFFFSNDVFETTDWLIAYGNGAAIDLDGLNKTIKNWYRAETDQLPTVLDVKTNGVDGASSSDVSISQVVPRLYSNNFQVEFDGTNYFIGSGVPDFTKAKTFSFWVTRETPLGNDFVYANAVNVSTNNAFKIYFDSSTANRIIFRIDTPSGDLLRRWQLGAPTLGVKSHIVITMPANNTDATDVKLYLNGVLVSPNQTTNAMTALPTFQNKISFGAGVAGGNTMHGKLDEFSLWDIELNQAQVDDLYNFGSPDDLFKVNFIGDLFQWFRFGDLNERGAIMLDTQATGAVVMINYDRNLYVGN